ncbi:DUF3226 domain-containing protein [Archangium primigenium]|uniref:DUF3226 domain-containing protein n=1 Tax=[Archangium] primigenium TaxID=2792470 RepID=UPI00195DAC24|nr:DUF3226 domain-containing protein [Archangium primigenium]MBM7116561.1 hypothetical protein [Archangium primigenium]
MPPPKNSPYRLMVEGPDDKHALLGLMKRHGYDWDDARSTRPHVEDMQGVSKLLDSANLSTGAKSLSRMGLVLDADLDVKPRWQQLRDCFSHLRIDLPVSPASEGTVVDILPRPDLKLSRLGIWLMPDNQQPGILEDFLGNLVPANDPCWAYAEEATVKARSLGGALAQKDQIKGRIHTWLAWQTDPGLPFGTALTARLLGHDSPQALAFVSWFQRLFVA